MRSIEELKESIISVENFPKNGIVFRDLTPIFQNWEATMLACTALARHCFLIRPIDKVAAVEARGFILGPLLAYNTLVCGFVPIRKSGKLPREVYKQEYTLEYGVNCLEIHQDSIASGESVIFFDDILATGGTAEASIKLIERCGGIVKGVFFLAEIENLGGRDKLKGYNVESVIKF